MRLLVRSWNVFHGRTYPETRRLHLEEAVRRIAAGEPDVVCLQEVPVWALRHLGAWSGLAVFGSVAMPARGGSLAKAITKLAPGVFRSALTGQANVLLVSRRLAVVHRETLQLNPSAFRRSEARRAHLPAAAERKWTRNRRVAQLVRLSAGGETAVLVNVHLTSPANCRAAELELERVVAFADDLAERGEPIVLCGDLNLTASRSPALRALAGLRFSPPCSGIDHILIRGLDPIRGPEAWPDSRRRVGTVLLSDHAPLEAAMIGP